LIKFEEQEWTEDKILDSVKGSHGDQARRVRSHHDRWPLELYGIRVVSSLQAWTSSDYVQDTKT